MAFIRLSHTLSHLSENLWFKTMATLIGSLAIVYLGRKFVIIGGEDVDFIYIWLSGYLWTEGLNPYSLAFIERGPEFFNYFNGQAFFYPPNWWPFSSFFGQFDYHISLEIWRFLNISMLLASTLVLNAAVRSIGINLSWSYLVFYTGLVSFMQATAMTLYMGQTAILIYFGLCMVIYGALSSKNLFLVFGFCLLLLKPQIGVPLMIAFVPFRIYQKAVFYACGMTILLMLPALLTFDPVLTITNYITGISNHGQFYFNAADNTTGLNYIFYAFSGTELSSLLIVFLSIFSVFGAMVFLKKKGFTLSKRNDSENKVILLMLSICFVCFLTPLHFYDYVFLAPIILLAAKLGNVLQWVVSILFLGIIRAENIVGVISGAESENVSYYTGMILMIIVFTILMILIVKTGKILSKV